MKKTNGGRELTHWVEIERGKPPSLFSVSWNSVPSGVENTLQCEWRICLVAPDSPAGRGDNRFPHRLKYPRRPTAVDRP